MSAIRDARAWSRSDRAIARWVIAIVTQELEIALERITATQSRECRRVVIGHRMVHAAHNRQTIHHSCSLGQVLADPNPRHRRRNRTKLAADLCRGIRLHIVSVNMAGPAVMKDQDARADRPSRRATFSPRSRVLQASARSRAGRVNPSEPRAADTKQLATTQLRCKARAFRSSCMRSITPLPYHHANHRLAGKLFNFHWRIEVRRDLSRAIDLMCVLADDLRNCLSKLRTELH